MVHFRKMFLMLCRRHHVKVEYIKGYRLIDMKLICRVTCESQHGIIKVDNL